MTLCIHCTPTSIKVHTAGNKSQKLPRQCNEWSIDDTTLTPSNRRGVTHTTHCPQLITFVSGSPPVRRPQVLLLLHYVLCSLFPCCVVAAQQGRSTRKSFCKIDKEFELMTKTIKKNFVQVSSFMIFMRGLKLLVYEALRY